MKQIHGKPVFEQGKDTHENGPSGPSSWARDFGMFSNSYSFQSERRVVGIVSGALESIAQLLLQ